MAVDTRSAFERALSTLNAACCPECAGDGDAVAGWWDAECSHGVTRGECGVCTGFIKPNDQEWDSDWAPPDVQPPRECAACRGSGFKDGNVPNILFGRRAA